MTPSASRSTFSRRDAALCSARACVHLSGAVVSHCHPTDRCPPGSSVRETAKQQYRSPLQFPTPGCLPNPGSKPWWPTSPTLADGCLLRHLRGRREISRPRPLRLPCPGLARAQGSCGAPQPPGQRRQAFNDWESDRRLARICGCAVQVLELSVKTVTPEPQPPPACRVPS